MDIPFREQHLLENCLVLSNIFKHCGLKDLKSCRLVSRLWRDASRLTFRSNAVVSICSSRKIGRIMSDFKEFTKNYANDRSQILDKAPFTNYFMHTVHSTWFYNFWGTSIKVLQVYSVDFKSENNFLKTIFQCCQNLEKLTLICVTVGMTETAKKSVVEQIDWARIPENGKLKSLELNTFKWNGVVWIEVLNRIPSLQDLTLKSYDTSTNTFKDISQSLAMIREENPTKLKLTLIDLRKLWGICPALLLLLLDLNLHLESLFLEYAFLRNYGYRLVDILDNHASSLKRLSLDANDGPNAVVPQNFQSQKQLECLQELRIVRYMSKDYSLAKFLQLCPNLRKLFFKDFLRECIGVDDFTGVQDMKLNYCTELEISVPRMTTQDLENLIRWMPNLKKLKIDVLNNQIFSMVCVGWPNLVSLHIRVAEMDDSGVTGLDIEDVLEINENGRNGIWRPITVPRAYITCLRDLQRLYLGDVYLNRLRVCAAVCGIELLSNLLHLKVQVHPYDMDEETRALWRNVSARYPWPEIED